MYDATGVRLHAGRQAEVIFHSHLVDLVFITLLMDDLSDYKEFFL